MGGIASLRASLHNLGAGGATRPLVLDLRSWSPWASTRSGLSQDSQGCPPQGVADGATCPTAQGLTFLSRYRVERKRMEPSEISSWSFGFCELLPGQRRPAAKRAGRGAAGVTVTDWSVSQDYPGFRVSRFFPRCFHFLHIIEHCWDGEHESLPRRNLLRSGRFTFWMNLGWKATAPVRWEQEELFFLPSLFPLIRSITAASNNPGLSHP